MRKASKAGLALIPTGRLWDRLLSQLKFVKDHGRLPSRAIRFNDVILRQKTAADFPKPAHTLTSDKELAKAYIAERVGRDHCVPTLAVLRSEDEVFAFEFPSSCAIKPTHSSGHIVIREQGEVLDKARIASWLEDDFYRRSREAQYRDLEPKIIVEPLVFGMADAEDFRFFCHRGQVRAVQWEARRTVHAARLFTPDWTDMNCAIGQPLSEETRARPDCLQAMLDAATALAKDFGFVRVDMFTDDKNYFVGELTHNHGNAAESFHPPEAEARISNLMFSDA